MFRMSRFVLAFYRGHGTWHFLLYPSGSGTTSFPPEIVCAHASADVHMQNKPVTRRIYLCEKNEKCIAIMLLILSGIL